MIDDCALPIGIESRTVKKKVNNRKKASADAFNRKSTFNRTVGKDWLLYAAGVGTVREKAFLDAFGLGIICHLKP